MKSKSVIFIVVILLAIIAYFIGTSLTSAPSDTDLSEVAVDESSVPVKPERKAEVYGKVIKTEGNLVTVAEIDLSADPTADMTTEEKRAYKQSLSEEERMALNESIQGATLGEVSVLIPVGIPMIKKSDAGPDAPEVEATLADVAIGSTLSVWLNSEVADKKVAEFVKVSNPTN